MTDPSAMDDRDPGAGRFDPTGTSLERLRHSLSTWFRRVARDLPWRVDRNPYWTWLSEIMLQQTRVDQAVPYFHRFVERFPTVQALAGADLDEVLRAWEGLGYYSRARNLHRAARLVITEFDGLIPPSYTELRSLPGVGPYTAAAIASEAFGLPHAAVDGNVLRVLARFSAEDAVAATGAGRRRIEKLAAELLDPVDPGRHNEALMELGATVCTPTRPECPSCPLSSWCRGYAEGSPEIYPIRAARKPVPHYDVAVGVVRSSEDRYLIQRRPEEAMLGGLWEFPGGKCEPGESPESACERELAEELGIAVSVDSRLATISHAYSHFRITMHAFSCRLLDGRPETRTGEPVRWVMAEELSSYAFPRANRRLIERLQDGPSPEGPGDDS